MEESQSLSTHKNTRIVEVTTHMHKCRIVEASGAALAIILPNMGTNKVGGHNCNYGAVNQWKQRSRMVCYDQINWCGISLSEISKGLLKPFEGINRDKGKYKLAC
jgi:hypothetical protein